MHDWPCHHRHHQQYFPAIPINYYNWKRNLLQYNVKRAYSDTSIHDKAKQIDKYRPINSFDIKQWDQNLAGNLQYTWILS